VAQVLGAIDIGASTVLVGVASVEGELVSDSVVSFATPSSAEELIASITSALAAVTGSAPIVRVGCVAPGPIDYENGVVLRLHNKAWGPLAIVQGLRDAFSCEVRLEDDAAAAAVAEARLGAGTGRNPVGYVTVSSGVGAGLVVNGARHRGAHGTAGEVGHLVVDPTGPSCNCGRRGDVESFAGGLSLVRQLVAEWPEPLNGYANDRSPAELFERAAAGDERALGILRRGRDALAHCFAAIATLWDPEVIVVGGSVALGQTRWIDESFEAARDLCMAEVGEGMRHEFASLGARSALIGAALLASVTS
jgi:glucokinase